MLGEGQATLLETASFVYCMQRFTFFESSLSFSTRYFLISEERKQEIDPYADVLCSPSDVCLL